MTTERQALDVAALRRLEPDAAAIPWTVREDAMALDECEDRWYVTVGAPPLDVATNMTRADAELVAALRNQLPAILGALEEREGLVREIARLSTRIVHLVEELRRLLLVVEAGPVEVWEDGPIEHEPARLGRREPETMAYAEDYPVITETLRSLAARKAEEVERDG